MLTPILESSDTTEFQFCVLEQMPELCVCISLACSTLRMRDLLQCKTAVWAAHRPMRGTRDANNNAQCLRSLVYAILELPDVNCYHCVKKSFVAVVGFLYIHYYDGFVFDRHASG